MIRLSLFVLVIALSVMFGWWIFLPLAILIVYMAVLPYEIILAGIILDSVYYFGDGFLYRYPLTAFSIILVFLAFILSKRIHWRKLV